MGGVVYGAVYNQKTKTVVYMNSDEIFLDRIMRSKYVQAEIGDTFHQVEQMLINGRNVLFSGTPCCVAGLKRYIEMKNSTLLDKLLLVDFLCEGVPSEKVFVAYQHYIEEKYQDQIEDVIFRSKKYGWRLHCMNIKFISNKEYTRVWWDDLYMCAFLNGLILNRPTCYSCKFRDDKLSDITLGDFWASEKYDFGCSNNKGTSIVTINTNKGISFMNSLEKSNLKELKSNDAHLAYQDLSKVSDFFEKRNAFYADFRKMGFEKAIRRHCAFIDELSRKQRVKMWFSFRVRIPATNWIKYLLFKLGLKTL